MKLPNQNHGPVRLFNIKYAANLSEETAAFTAECIIDKIGGCTVRNNGRGGPNCFDSPKISEAVKAYAKTLHDVPAYGMSLKMDADLLISTMIEAAVRAGDDAKFVKKGFTHCSLLNGRVIYTIGEPTPAVIAKHFKEGRPEIRRLSALADVAAEMKLAIEEGWV